MSFGGVSNWPAVAGTYKIGDPKGSVAVCALTSEMLVGSIAGLPGVAIAGIVQTANLGIERIIQNVSSNPSIRFLVVCGKDSLFRPGQTLVALAENGVDEFKRIVGAVGYDPILRSVSEERVTQFRKQVEVVDWSGEEDLQVLKEGVGRLKKRNPGLFEGGATGPEAAAKFAQIIPGGKREPLVYDPKGYFVITLEREKGEIVLRHHLPDHTPAHEMRGHSATSILLGLLREGLVTQLSHSGYLGEELAKAEAALSLGIRYDQDRPLRPGGTSHAAEAEPVKAAAPDMAGANPTSSGPRVPMTAKQLVTVSPPSKVDVVLRIVDILDTREFEGLFLEPDEAEPFRVFTMGEWSARVLWDDSTRTIMGSTDEIVKGAIVRIVGPLEESHRVKAEQIVILTKVAKVKEAQGT